MLVMKVGIWLAAAALAASSANEAPPLPGSEEFAQHPSLVQWLEVWLGTDVQYHPEQFQLVSAHDHSIGQGYTYPEEANTPSQRQSWISSPDGVHAVCVSRPGDSPDSEVDLVDLAAGRRTAVCTCGTLCTFEMPAWLDAETILVGSGDWENLAPDLVRIDLAAGRIERFRGPTVPAERKAEIWAGVQTLWDEHFAASE